MIGTATRHHKHYIVPGKNVWYKDVICSPKKWLVPNLTC
jgi:hypothetical protein